MKKHERKLGLERELIRRLSVVELGKVEGGGVSVNHYTCAPTQRGTCHALP